MSDKSSRLSPFYVIPKYTFFYWGFTLKKEIYSEYTKYFNLNANSKSKPITLIIKNKKYDATIRIARINNKGKSKTRSDTIYPEREPVQIFYDREVDTRKALRKFMIYSYAATIDKSKPKLKELVEFTHIGNDTFKLKAFSKQETDFDDMFHFLEDKNLFAFWQDYNQKNQKDSLFIDYSRQWLSKKDISKYSTRNNVLYLLNNSKTNQLYVGKANNFGNRVTEKSSRVGLKTYDRFLFFELNPKYDSLLDNLENFSIKLLASLFTNLVNIKGLDLDQMTLVNKQIKS